MGKDEDASERELNRLGKVGKKIYCGKRYTNDAGERTACTKKPGHWGKVQVGPDATEPPGTANRGVPHVVTTTHCPAG
jgi:hypothetical protein